MRSSTIKTCLNKKNHKEENITMSEWKRLLNELSELREENEKLRNKVGDLENENAKLKEKMYGIKIEEIV